MVGRTFRATLLSLLRGKKFVAGATTAVYSTSDRPRLAVNTTSEYNTPTFCQYKNRSKDVSVNL